MSRYGKEFVEQGLAYMMMLPGIERKYTQRIENANARQTKPQKQDPQILRQEPYHNVASTEEGIVRELKRDVNLLKRLKLVESDVGRAIIKSIGLGRNPVAQITIHTGALAEEDNSSFTFLIRQKVLDEKGIIIGDFVICSLRGVSIAGREAVWICHDLKGSFD